MFVTRLIDETKNVFWHLGGCSNRKAREIYTTRKTPAEPHSKAGR